MARSTKASGTRQTSRGGERGIMATQLLKKDHDTVKQLFGRYEKQGDRAQGSKQQIFSEIERDLEAHSTIEEEIFYPAVQDGVADAKDLVQEAVEEHNVVKSLLRELGSMSPDDEQFDAKITVLRESVEHHVEEEEGEMFPKVEQQLGSERLQQLGAELQARKETLGQPTIKRIINGVSGLIFGNGGTGEEGEGEEKPARSRGRSGQRAQGTREREQTPEARGRSARGEMQPAGAASAERRSAAKTATKRRGAKKRVSGRRSSAQTSASAVAKKRQSGRSAQAKAGARRSGARKRGTAGGTSGRSRTARKTARKR